MDKMYFDILIDAPKEKVFDVMISKEHYNDWTTAFDPSSSFDGKWEKGAKLKFIGSGEDGAVYGMISEVEDIVRGERVILKHIGIVANGVEDYTSDQVKKWAPAYENYFFDAEDGKTRVRVEMETLEENKPYFVDTWPAALQLLKTICEK